MFDERRVTLDVWWTATRATRISTSLSSILSHYVAPGKKVEIVRDALGKPRIKSAALPGFNVSYAGSVSLVGVGPIEAIGVDCQAIEDFEEMGGADLVFSPRERAWLTSGEVASRASRFCDLWTRKEAVVKAIGGGLQVPLGSFDVLSGNFRLCAEVTVPGLGRWWLTSIDAPPGVAAACAAGAPFAARLRRAWPT